MDYWRECNSCVTHFIYRGQVKVIEVFKHLKKKSIIYKKNKGLSNKGFNNGICKIIKDFYVLQNLFFLLCWFWLMFKRLLSSPAVVFILFKNFSNIKLLRSHVAFKLKGANFLFKMLAFWIFIKFLCYAMMQTLNEQLNTTWQ